jgi:uncharacterized membrane protein
MSTQHNDGLFNLQGPWRRTVYVSLYELIAILCTTVLLKFMSSGGAAESLALAVLTSIMAVIWNLIFNSVFEYWEAKRTLRGRSVSTRVLHALGFEGGLLLSLTPLVGWWYGIGLSDALTINASLLVFFLVYTFVFTWVFDRVFGLPSSAR